MNPKNDYDLNVKFLKGNFQNVSQPNSNLIRIFLSSTTTGV